MRTTLFALALGLGACGLPAGESGGQVDDLARELAPRVEEAVGVSFRSAPRVAVRSRDDVRRYLIRKLDDELPPEELEGMVLAYRLFGLIPDTLDVRALLLDLYLEQVVGYYDPDSATLYVVEGGDPATVRFTLAHELVHALQGQYAPLDSLLSLERQNDRRMAAQAVFEGQATLAQIRITLPDMDPGTLDASWEEFWQAVRQQHDRMPVFAAAPLILRETLVFPYLAGAHFMAWFAREYGDTAVPYGARLPRSTEQILHPDRYRAGDDPVTLRFPAAPAAVYEDGLGEFETRVLLRELTGSDGTAAAGARGWDGDRYVVWRTPDGEPVLVWVSVWDDGAAADRFARLLTAHWRVVPPRQLRVERLELHGIPAVRVVNAPAGWEPADPGLVPVVSPDRP